MSAIPTTDWASMADISAQWAAVQPGILEELHRMMRRSAEIKPERGEQDALVGHTSKRRRDIVTAAAAASRVGSFQISLDETVIWEPAGRDKWRVVLPWQVLRKLEEIAYVPELAVAIPRRSSDGDGEREEERVANRLMAVAREIEGRNGSWAGSGEPTMGYLRWLATQYRSLYKCYYTLTPPKSNEERARKSPDKHFRENWEWRIEQAESDNALELAWACRLAMEGPPKRISSFYVKPLFSLKKENGEYVRVIEVFTENDKSWVLEIDGEAYSAPSYLRKVLNARAGGSWMAGERELQLAMVDWSVRLEWQEVEEVSVFGWHPGASAWFFKDCAIDFRGEIKVPDSNGVITLATPHAVGKGTRWKKYRMSETDKDGMDFYLKEISMHPEIGTDRRPVRLDRSEIAAFFSGFLSRAHDIVGGWDAFLAIGITMAYAVAPEIFHDHEAFPGLWIHGEAKQGKSSLARWLGKFWSIRHSRSLTSSTGAGAETMLQQYANLPLVLDEAQTVMRDAVAELLKDCFNRIPSAKRVENLRQILTSPIVMGVATSGSEQTRSRYAHVLVSSLRRLPQAGSLIDGYSPPVGADASTMPADAAADGARWTPAEAERCQQDNYDWIARPGANGIARENEFYKFGRWALENRPQFSEVAMATLREWLRSRITTGLDERSKLVHGVALAGLTAMIQTLGIESVRVSVGSKFFECPVADFLEYFQKHLVNCSREAVKAAQEQADIDRFWSDLLVAFQRGAFGHGWTDWKAYFKPVYEESAGPPGIGPDSIQSAATWRSWTLHLQPDAVFSALKEWKRGQGETIGLRKLDTESQLSAKPYWIRKPRGARQRFGGNAMQCWSVRLDTFHDLGYTAVDDRAYQSWLDAKLAARSALDTERLEVPLDPRCGPLVQLCGELETARVAP